MVRVTHLLEPCGRPSWLLSGASTALCLPRSGQLGRVFTSGRGSVRTGSIPHSIPSLLHRAEHEEKPAGAYADKRGRSIFQTRRRLRAQMTLRGALNTRREDGGAAPSACCAAGKRDLPRISRSGVRSGRADSRSGRQVNFSFKGNGIGDCRLMPPASLSRQEPSQARAARPGGPVAMLLRSSRFGSGHDRRKGGGQALKLASRLCRGCEPNVGEPFRERCGASRRSCRTARTPWRGLGTPGTGTPVEQNGF